MITHTNGSHGVVMQWEEKGKLYRCQEILIYELVHLRVHT